MTSGRNYEGSSVKEEYEDEKYDESTKGRQLSFSGNTVGETAPPPGSKLGGGGHQPNHQEDTQSNEKYSE